jgi:hypothetical protein
VIESANFDTFSQAVTQVGQKGLDAANRAISTPKAGGSKSHGLTQISQIKTAGSQIKATKSMASAEMKMATAQSVSQSVSTNGGSQSGGGLIVDSSR